MEGYFDIHCHILPGVDDGAADIETTRQMLRVAWEEGIRGMIATPHFHMGRIEVSAEKLRMAWEQTRACAQEISEEFQIYLGNELYSSHSLVELLDAGKIFPMAGSRYTLVEFSVQKGYSELEASLKQLQMAGYRPILAHAERYECLLKNPYRVEELADMGILIQVNAASVTGENGFAAKRFVKKLLKYELVHFLGTDAHDMKTRKPLMKKCVSYIAGKYGEDYARRISRDNALRILDNLSVR
ncbi:MAG: CpsB/CapC family capsule biosynthesis tyrosine phosphatase [Marvinbryantia sp.]|uniref:CpsB/CapC family capsule biosynthesis tyrosine phosphatase n=1 Tax=Marvinbryantia sp. TaxID=2496532 RepID=UPI0025D0FBAB|nr:CpsB/CapC family capsule biosynthesis tyrosine phosphatase [uncultured Marvinbryantia sp.]